MEDNRRMGRRELLRRGGIASLGLGMGMLGTGCNDIRNRVQAMTSPAPAQWTPLPRTGNASTNGLIQAVHVLNRIANGPRPGDVARVVQMGVAAYIEEQLGDGVPAKEQRERHLSAYEQKQEADDWTADTPGAKPANPGFKLDFGDWNAKQPTDNLGEDAGMVWRINSLDSQQYERDMPDAIYSIDDTEFQNQTTQTALLRAIYSRHQLREVMADFWTNHFNIYALKNEGRSLIPTDTERVLRPNALTRFEDLLVASAHSPAMLAYLDNNQNRKRIQQIGQDGKDKSKDNANENYARELLELHTLGVKSGYTQRDIQEVARCFTGWTVTTGWNPGKFTYDRSQHDEDAKFIPFLNLTITPNGGRSDARKVLHALAHHPVTARFLARKLCRRFLGTTPDAIIEKAANAYLQNDTDIRALLRPILLDALTDPQYNQPILKRPLDYVVTSLRAFAADSDGGVGLQRELAKMGQPLYMWPMPDGFPEKPTSWTGSMLPRWNYALALATNQIAGTHIDLEAPLKAANANTDDEILNTLIETIYGRPHDAQELSDIRAQLSAHRARARDANVPIPVLLAETSALLMAAPAFQWK